MNASHRGRTRWLVLIGLVGGVFVLYTVVALQWASTSLGCDYAAYHHAADRLRSGLLLYDASVHSTGECGIFQYPPPFTLIVLPLTFLPLAAATWAWIVLMTGCFVLGVALLPVGGGVRLMVLLIGGVSWPFQLGLRIGTVGPLLFLLSVLSWRWLERPVRLGAATGAGFLVKLQPVILVGWMVLTRRWRAVGAFAALVGGASLAAALVGAGAWHEWFALLGRLSGSAYVVGTNGSVGAIAYFAGLGTPAAVAAQWGSTILVLLVVAWASLRLGSEPSFLIAVVASQLVSPMIWDHYAIQLLLPIAWLLERRQWWILIVPLSQAWMLVALVPLSVYLAGYFVTLAGVAAVAWQVRQTSAATPPLVAPS